MSLLRLTARRSLGTALSSTTPAVCRIPVLARPLSIYTAQRQQREDLMKHAPGWKHENASESEASVKADREPHSRDVTHMQQETIKHMKEEEDVIDNIKAKVSETASEFVDKAKSLGSDASNQGGEYIDKAKRAGQEAKKEFGEKTKPISDKERDYVDQAKKAGQEAKKAGEEFLSESDYGERAKKEASNAQGMMKDGAQKVSDFVKSTVDSAKKAVGMDSSSSSSSNKH
ncbi:hypothetical protein BGZ95_000258 [Linnemannia exigua]|uniref:Uncharacterized protein n=1 Tax=Linnemannia exigua TaxID=604196 RepID=A0AAD4H3K7_9FUNG|nr:hypothetical protein BGZ95_000258 [Linnemannia exigua]